VRELKALDMAFEQARRKAQAVIVLPDSVINADPPRITAIAAKHRLPSIYSARAMVEAGRLMSYGPDFAVQWRRAAE
jgi:putative ABC transport system substrate-binding protein